MVKKAKRKSAAKPKSRKRPSGPRGERKPPNAPAEKDKDELLRIWNEDLCE